MTKNINHISHKKSNVKNQDGTPMLPSASNLVDGEIAVNYADGVETLSIKNDSGNVITFSSDNYYTEKKLGSGFTGENSANTVTKVIEDNELVWTNAYVAMSGNVSSHTVNTDVHLSSADRILIDSLPTTLNSKAEKSLDLDNLKLLRISQSDYNALVTKDPNTLYIIIS